MLRRSQLLWCSTLARMPLSSSVTPTTTTTTTANTSTGPPSATLSSANGGGSESVEASSSFAASFAATIGNDATDDDGYADSVSNSSPPPSAERYSSSSSGNGGGVPSPTAANSLQGDSAGGGSNTSGSGAGGGGVVDDVRSSASSSSNSSSWSEAQYAYRHLLVALRGAYFHDRARLFWARHKVKVEFYKYATLATGDGSSTIAGANGSSTPIFAETLQHDKLVEGEDVVDDRGSGENDDSHEDDSNDVDAGSGEMRTKRTLVVNKRNKHNPLHCCLDAAEEVSRFVSYYMQTSISRIEEHNETMMTLPVSEAKRYRAAYLLRESQHDSWCKQKIRDILSKRPPPPFPYS